MFLCICHPTAKSYCPRRDRRFLPAAVIANLMRLSQLSMRGLLVIVLAYLVYNHTYLTDHQHVKNEYVRGMGVCVSGMDVCVLVWELHLLLSCSNYYVTERMADMSCMAIYISCYFHVHNIIANSETYGLSTACHPCHFILTYLINE
jgi:hypothetical protein